MSLRSSASATNSPEHEATSPSVNNRVTFVELFTTTGFLSQRIFGESNASRIGHFLIGLSPEHSATSLESALRIA